MKMPILHSLPRMPKSLLKVPKGFKKHNVKEFEEDMQRLGEDIAQSFMEQVVENIEENAYGFNNAESTIRKKGSDIPLIATHEMVDSIYREETTVSVEDTLRIDSQLTNKQLAIVHEYGVKDRGIPSRPVWRNTFRDFKGDAREMVEQFLKTQRFNRKKK